MADLKISELSALAGANLVAADELAIVDDSASETKKITVSDLIANGVTLISDDTIPGAKILFAAGDIATAALADDAVATAKVADDAITAAKLADESTVDLVTTLPASGAFTGQLALDTDDNSLYAWDGSAWQSIAAPGSINTVSGSTTGEVNIVATTSGSTVTISATLDNTTSAAQFLAGPTGSAGAVGYRTIVGSDLPTATASAKGGVIVNGNGLTLSGDTLEIDNLVTSSATHHVVTYDANGLITGGRAITSADLPFATETTVGAVSVGDGLAVGAAGELSVDNTVTAGTYTKVTVTGQGLVSSGTTLEAADIPDHSAAKLTSGTIGTSLIANDAITADKMADQSTTKFGGAAGSDNVTIFPNGDFQGQFFYDETTQDLYIYTGSSFVPITVLSGNLVNAGAYNASTNQMSSVTSAGSSAGFSVGAALPAPAQTNLNHYVVVDTSGTGTGAAPAVALAPPDMLLSQGVGTEYSLIDVSNAIAGQTASNISLIATGNIIATDVQAGIQELDSEKLAKAGDTMTGALGIGTASSIVFEGSTADDYETTLTVTDPTADRTITFPDVTGNVVTTGDTGTVTSTMILDGTIVNADINASAEIAVSKLADGAARQLLQTDAAGTGVEWASNIDIPGTLDVTSTATFDSTVTVTGLITANGKVSFPAGTAAAPGLYSGTDIDTGIYAPGANEFGIATAGSAALTIDLSQQVGIGTVSPSSKLHVDHDINAEAYTIIENSRNYGFGVGIDFKQPFVNAGSSIVGGRIRSDYESDNNSFFAFSTLQSGTLDERMRLDSSGRLGIGTTSPQALVDITDASNQPSLRLSTSTASNFLEISRSPSTGHYTIASEENGSSIIVATDPDGTGAQDRVTIDRYGNVGIGTASPTAKLQIESTSDQLKLTYPSIASYIHEVHSNGDYSVAKDSSERMRIDSSGNVGIGKTPTALLDVDGDALINGVTVGKGTGTENTVLGNNAFSSSTSSSYNVAVGGEALQQNTTGSQNVAIGYRALDANTTANNNIAIGQDSLTTNTTGTENVALGSNSLRYNSTANDNTAIGYKALESNTTGSQNTGVGAYVLYANTTAGDNTAVGYNALTSNTTGGSNSALGHQAMLNNTTGTRNVAVGRLALDANTTGSYNTSIGFNSLTGNTTGSFNVGLGDTALGALTGGNYMVAIGYNALGSVTTQQGNTAVGHQALVSNTANYNVAVGYNSAVANTSGTRNVAVGASALDANTTASDNTAIGFEALTNTVTGNSCTAVGSKALEDCTGSDNTAVGMNAARATTSGVYNTAVGRRALELNTTGSYNTAIGGLCLDAATSALYNTGVGYGTLANATTGPQNTAIGFEALEDITTGGYNTAIGGLAGYQTTTANYNTLLGYRAGDNLTTGSGNTLVGYNVETLGIATSSSIVIGKDIVGIGGAGYVTIGMNSASDRIYNQFQANATWTRSSDVRLKKDIQTNTDLGLSFINDLRTVTYKWRAPSELDPSFSDYDANKTEANYTKKMYGFIAQEVKQALDDHGVTDFAGWNVATGDEELQGVSYEMFVMPLVKAVQELSAENAALKARLDAANI